MERQEVKDCLAKQKNYFLDGKTLSVENRLMALSCLESAIKKYEAEIMEALKLDLGKSYQEAFMCEYGLTLSEINHMKKNLEKYARVRRKATPLTNFAAKSFVVPMPYGTVLIMSPWNYPFLLTLEPLVDALAAGNTAFVKPSAYSPNTSEVIKKILEEAFDEQYVKVVIGGREENKNLLEEKFDYIFFTGSQAVGKTVMEAAAKHLTPVTLELGGKSPCIIDKSANISLAARRVVFGKYLNCGQTCVAPDYILCHEDVKDAFIKAVKKEIKKQYGSKPLKNKSYGKMINDKHYKRVCGLIDAAGDRVYGGERNDNELRIAPTIIDNVTYDDAVMKEEIFGPVMPVITFKDIRKVVYDINSGAHPLALYIFADDKRVAGYVIKHSIHGGGCINDTIIHLACSTMGFGGVGESGMGSYHGKTGFDAFSHMKSIVDKKNWLDLDMRYQPYGKIKMALIKLFLR